MFHKTFLIRLNEGLIKTVDIDKSIDYLQSTEEQHAHLKAQVKVFPDRLKSLVSDLELKSSEGTQAGKKADAMAHSQYKAMLDAYETIMREFNVLSEKRARAMLQIEMFRSVNSRIKANI